MINHIFISLTAVQIHDLLYIHLQLMNPRAIDIYTARDIHSFSFRENFPTQYHSYRKSLIHQFRYIWVIDQVWGQVGWILPEFFFFSRVMDRDGVQAGIGVHKNAKKRTSHLDRKSLVNEGFIVWFKGKFFSRDTVVIPSEQDILLINREWGHYSESQTEALMYWPTDSEVNTLRPRSEISL